MDYSKRRPDLYLKTPICTALIKRRWRYSIQAVLSSLEQSSVWKPLCLMMAGQKGFHQWKKISILVQGEGLPGQTRRQWRRLSRFSTTMRQKNTAAGIHGYLIRKKASCSTHLSQRPAHTARKEDTRDMVICVQAWDGTAVLNAERHSQSLLEHSSRSTISRR